MIAAFSWFQLLSAQTSVHWPKAHISTIPLELLDSSSSSMARSPVLVSHGWDENSSHIRNSSNEIDWQAWPQDSTITLACAHQLLKVFKICQYLNEFFLIPSTYPEHFFTSFAFHIMETHWVWCPRWKNSYYEWAHLCSWCCHSVTTGIFYCTCMMWNDSIYLARQKHPCKQLVHW